MVFTDFLPAVAECRYTGAPGISLGQHQPTASWRAMKAQRSPDQQISGPCLDPESQYHNKDERSTARGE